MSDTSSTSHRPMTVTPAGLLLSVSLIICTIIGAHAFSRAKAMSNVISVTGSAERTMTSDRVKWVSSFSRNIEVAALKDGNNQMKQDLQNIRALFKKEGVKDEEITVQAPNVTSVCENQSAVTYDNKTGSQICGKIIGYSLQQTITVESDDVQKIRKLSETAAGTFIDQGLIFSNQTVEYYYSKLADLKLDMLTEATKNAKDRAEKIVNSTGGSLGPIQTASMGVFQVTAVNSTEVSDYGAYDTSAVEKKVTAVVRASFTLK